MQKVIGLDLGTYSIKALEIVNNFNSYEIVNFYEKIITPIKGLTLEQAYPIYLEQLFEENNLQADKIIAAMPGQSISSRIMSFNFSDPRKIEASMEAELEAFVPFNLNDMIVDHQIIGEFQGKTVVLAVMTQKSYLANFLDHLKRVDIDPRLVDIDSLAFYNLSNMLNLDPEKCTAILDLGHEKTSLCIVHKGVLRMFRSINLGGKYITELVSRDLELDFEEAQEFKHRVGHVLSEKNPGDNLNDEDRIIAERITLGMSSIVKELGRTLFAFKNWEKSPIHEILISGGTSRLSGVEDFLSEELSTQVRKNEFDHGDLKIKDSLEAQMDIIPQSLAIGLRAVTSVKRLSQINLRKGEFAYVQDYQKVLSTAFSVSKALMALTLLLACTFGVKYWYYGSQISKTEKEYAKRAKVIFPQLKSSIKKNTKFSKTKKSVEKIFKSELSQKQTAFNDFIEKRTSSNALASLAAISAGVPKDLKLDVTNFQFNVSPEGGQVEVRGETDSYKSSASIADAINKIEQFKDVKRQDESWKPGSNKKILEFTILAKYEGK